MPIADTLLAPLLIGLVLVIVVVFAIVTVKNLIVIVPPNRAAVITGRNRLLGSGESVGYRSVSGGRTLRLPIIETVAHMNLETIPIEVSRPSSAQSSAIETITFRASLISNTPPQTIAETSPRL